MAVAVAVGVGVGVAIEGKGMLRLVAFGVFECYVHCG